MTLQPFVSILTAFRALLLDEFPEFNYVGTSWPENAELMLPVARIEKIPGSRTRLNDRPVLDLEVLHSTAALAESLAERVDAWLLGYPLSVRIEGRLIVLDEVTVPRPPAELFWEDGNADRYAATYAFSIRRR